MNEKNQRSQTISILVNGQSKHIQTGCSIKILLAELEIKSRAIAVELNEEIISPMEFGDTMIEDGDRVEIVTLVGGG